MITYPRTCESCNRSYSNRSSFCNHKIKCPEYTANLIIDREKKAEALKSRREIESTIQMVSNTTNHHQTVNDNSVKNTSVVINVQNNISGVPDSLAPILKSSSLSAQDIKCVEKVLLMLRKEGVTTPSALQTLIDEKSVTIQQLAEDIKDSNDRDCDAAIEFGASEAAKQKKLKQNKVETNRLIDLHLRHSVVHLFQSLVLKKEGEGDLQVTSDSLAANPLYLSRDGLSVWSQETGIKPGVTAATKFGYPDKKELCSWLLVQEDRLWRTLIMDVLIARLKTFLIEEHTGPLKEMKKQPDIEDPAKYLIAKMMDCEDEEEEEYHIGGHKYEGKYSDLMNRIRGFSNEGTGKESFITATMSELKKHLNEICKQASTKGWFHLTNHSSEQRDAQNLIVGAEQLRITSQ